LRRQIHNPALVLAGGDELEALSHELRGGKDT
jgi:hypothetical protein